jgi:hypothetical protein
MSTFYKINNVILDVSRISCVSKSTEDNELIVSMGDINHVFNGQVAEDIFNLLESFCLNPNIVEVDENSIEFKEYIKAVKKANYFHEDYEKIYYAQTNNVDRAIKKMKTNYIDFETFYNTMRICGLGYKMNTLANWINDKGCNVLTKTRKIEEIASVTECVKWWLQMRRLKPEKVICTPLSKQKKDDDVVKNFNPFKKNEIVDDDYDEYDSGDIF